MMNVFSRSACALALLVAIPALAFAQQPRGGNGSRTAAPAARSAPAAPAARPAPAFRAAAPAPRPAPVARTAPQTTQAPPIAGGFNFNHDITTRPVTTQPVMVRRPVTTQPVTVDRPVTTQPIVRRSPVTTQQPVLSQQPPRRTGNPGVANYPHAPYANTGTTPFHRRFTGPVVRNTRAPGGNWGWNRGVVWQPAPVYWGGGFWGPFAIAALANSLLYGSIVDDQDQLQYPSYQVEPDSPGAELLQDYGLQQTQCGPPGLVNIWGPDNSVICAFPNDQVGPGNYEVDQSTFTLIPESQ
jgi:hypothetical protein